MIRRLRMFKVNARGWMASKLPRGICRTTLVSIATACTNRAPRSILRWELISEEKRINLFSSAQINWWCWAEVTSKKFEWMANELTVFNISFPSQYSRPLAVKPMRRPLMQSKWRQSSGKRVPCSLKLKPSKSSWWTLPSISCANNIFWSRDGTNAVIRFSNSKDFLINRTVEHDNRRINI